MPLYFNIIGWRLNSLLPKTIIRLLRASVLSLSGGPTSVVMSPALLTARARCGKMGTLEKDGSSKPLSFDGRASSRPSFKTALHKFLDQEGCSWVVEGGNAFCVKLQAAASKAAESKMSSEKGTISTNVADSDSQYFKDLRRGVLRAFWDLKAENGVFFRTEVLRYQILKLVPLRTNLMVADALTKSLPAPAHAKHRDVMIGRVPFCVRTLRSSHCVRGG